MMRNILVVMACACAAALPGTNALAQTRPDTAAIVATARQLSADSMRGRGPWSADATRAARMIAWRLTELGARPVVGSSLLVPFTAPPHPRDTVYNVIAVLPDRAGRTDGQLVGVTAHLDHLGIGPPDARGDSVYNGFLDDAMGVAMVLDAARRYQLSPGNRPLLVMIFNLEEQGLLGSRALIEQPAGQALAERIGLLVGVDAGSPAGAPLEWQLMGGLPAHAGSRIADSLARARGWTTTSTPPRAINDVFTFSQRGVPILFPIPGKKWRGYTDAERAEAMREFDHYHQPSDEYRPGFPLAGTAAFADWLYDILTSAANETLRR